MENTAITTVKLRNRGELTIPEDVRSLLKIGKDSILELNITVKERHNETKE